MTSNVKEVATLIANVANLTREISEVKGILLSSGQQRVTQHTDTTARLSVIESNQKRSEDTFKEYTEKCDKDREALHTEVAELKTWKDNQAAAVSMRSSIVSGIITTLGLGLAYLGIKYK